MIAEEIQGFDTAENLHRKSLEIFEKQGNEHSAATTYGQLGNIAGLREKYDESGMWLIKSILTFSRCNAPHDVQRNTHNFMILYEMASSEGQANLESMWRKAGLGELPEG